MYLCINIWIHRISGGHVVGSEQAVFPGLDEGMNVQHVHVFVLSLHLFLHVTAACASIWLYARVMHVKVPAHSYATACIYSSMRTHSSMRTLYGSMRTLY